MKFLLFITFVIAALANDSDVFEGLTRVLKKGESPVVMPWLLPTSSTAESSRSYCFVGEQGLVNLASETKARGYSVVFSSLSSPVLPHGVDGLEMKESTEKSNFGEAFDQSVALYNTLKNEVFDVIVFSSNNGLAYMCMEAKKAGIAFQQTVLVLNVEEAPIGNGKEYHALISQFMLEQSIELADSVFTSNEHLFDGLTYSSPVSVWSVSNNAVGLLENVQAKEMPTVDSAAPLVSVIITSFNRPAMLKQAVDSVKAQTFKNVEIIVVDDGSTVAEMAEVLSALERNGVVVIRQQNQYLGAARNAGAKIAKGDFLLFLDDDNVALSSMVTTLVHAAQISESKIAVNAHYVWHAQGKGVEQIPADLTSLQQWCPVGPAVVAGLRGNVFGNANFMIEKETFFALSGFTEDRTGWEDYEFHAKAAIAGVSFVVVPEPLMLYRQHNHFDQMSASTDKKANIKRVMRAYKHLLNEAKTSEEAMHNFVERGVDTCTAAAFVNPTTTACVDTAATVTTAGAAGAYGGVQIAPIVSIVNGTSTFSLTWNVDYTYTSPAANSNTGDWTITLVSSSPTFQNIVQQSFGAGTTVALNIGFQSTATVQCPSLSISATSLPNCAVVCFHKDTVVEYEGELHGLESLRNHPSCAIPHIVRSHGVSIFTTCTPDNALRLTNDHLVYTDKGLVAAGAIKVGDVVFADLNQQHPCKVEKVVADTEEQEFFGLNCLKSTVLANQIKTSTFGRLHTVPSIWMSWVGNAVGVKRASTWGDAIAQVANKLHIF